MSAEDLRAQPEWWSGPSEELKQTLGAMALEQRPPRDVAEAPIDIRPRRFRRLRREIEAYILGGLITKGYDMGPQDSSGEEPAERLTPNDSGPGNIAMELPRFERSAA